MSPDKRPGANRAQIKQEPGCGDDYESGHSIIAQHLQVFVVDELRIVMTALGHDAIGAKAIFEMIRAGPEPGIFLPDLDARRPESKTRVKNLAPGGMEQSESFGGFLVPLCKNHRRHE